MWNGTHTEACDLNGFESVICLTIFACTGFTSDFRFYGYYYISCSYPALSLVSYSTSLLFFPYHTMSTSCLIFICSCLLLLTTRFSMHVYNSVLSIHVDLFLHAIWLLPHHSPGEFYLTPLDPHVQVMELGACGFP